jgi:hypothetical protein
MIHHVPPHGHPIGRSPDCHELRFGVSVTSSLLDVIVLGSVMDSDGGPTRLVSYEERNPEWDRVHDLCQSATTPADVLAQALDQA